MTRTLFKKAYWEDGYRDGPYSPGGQASAHTIA
jgi:hypothetical protein